ncbi:hypothetical protein BFP77_04675 [Maribacter sp. 4U21]|uniref:PQQ-dependent sugar dehydrogenase n=1 Tax=Maribacter sp. 4U21 TaxID=1889779 RepID=UPI000C14E1C2|nr:PQQ-dependent sugar dehydrogenase [Maribacter sp. 4U21]PIB29923.1 hypothetical protein BFP77_04675 [Maribacter sp. 4U21]
MLLLSPIQAKTLNNLLFIVVMFNITYSQIGYQEAYPNLSFNFPVEIQNASDGSNRMFVVEQSGLIKVFPNDQGVTNGQVSTFLDISQKIAYNAGQEIGLLGLAFHPDFVSNGYVYVYYIDEPSNYRINVVRYRVSGANANSVDTSSETVIAQFTKNQGESNHNGGKIAFGPDGYLYISIGDGGGGGDPQGNAQNLNTVFGSILRIDVDIDGSNPIEENPELPNGNYEIPSDNPRRGLSGLDELYAWGIRNTWKFSFDETGRLWGADVGQSAFEEINLITNGGNYGWNRFEGNSDYHSNISLTTSPDTKPVFTYGHGNGDKSITGGYMYRGSLSSASLVNKYIYADFLTGRIWALSYNASDGSASSELLFRANGQAISSFGEDESGELYFIGYGANAKLFRLTETVSEPVTNVVNGVGGWQGVANGTDGPVTTIASDNNDTKYIGGNFSLAGELNVSDLAVISPDEQWGILGPGSNGTINVLAIAPNGNVFVGGEFTEIGGVNANNIAFWNGSSWSAMGSGTNGEVQQLKFDQNGGLFVAGVFTTANGITVNNIARWQNNSWFALTDSATNQSGTNNEIRSLAIDDENNLYVGGNFDNAGGISASRIASWNGSNWTGIGDGTSGFVQAITVGGDFLYAAGNFALAGNTTVNRIARWNLTTSTWEALGNGLSGSVNALEWDGDFIYVGGDFETASNTEDINLIVNNVARWNPGLGWQALGTNTQVGVNARVNSLQFSNTDNELFVGGSFTTAGDSQANNIAIWSEQFCSENSIIPEYQVNGVWDSGNDTLTITSGDTLTLSILPNDTEFTITLPNGETFPNDYDLGAVSTDMAGTYIFTSAQGCTESFNLIINGNPTEEEDSDNDGIFNNDDLCPDTPLGETVDANGCSPSQLDDDNDGVSNADDICPNTAANASVDNFGCSSAQKDIDEDGVNNANDLCNDTPSGETVDANGCSGSQLDTDGDGVNNSNDNCPNTPVGAIVSSDGCEITALPLDQFSITSNGNSCVTTIDGIINVVAKSTGIYTAQLITKDESDSFQFTDSLEIEGLVPGEYTLCITVQDYSDYENCSKIIITAPQPLTVESSINNEIELNSVTLKMSGGATYSISINGKTIETEDNEITLALTKDINTIRVSSEINCQGIHEEIIALDNAVMAYPNPATDFVTIDLRNIDSETVRITMYAESGAQLSSNLFNTAAGTVTLKTSHLTKGIYFIRVKNDVMDKSLKLIKL